MRSLRSVIKGRAISSSEDVIEIPDRPRLRPIDPSTISSPEYAAAQRLEQHAYEQILEKAQAEGETLQQKLMLLAHQEREEILDSARQEALNIKEEAWQSGYQTGLQQRKEEIDRMLQDFNRTIAELKIGQKEFLEHYFAETQTFALEIASKIMLRQVTLDETSVADLVKSAVGSVKDVDWLTVKLPEQMPLLIEQLRREFPPGSRVDGKRVEVVESDLSHGNCVLETPVGSIDVSIQTQIEKLREYFEKG